MIDVLVAGGGPAGLATAILGARAGLEVVVVERRRGPVDKACGEGLMPHAVTLLGSLGVDAPGKPFHGITYVETGTA
jgi:flavin-dependent dehydrogenase